MFRWLCSCLLVLSSAFLSVPLTADEPLHIIAFGAHPDDCDIRSGGVAALSLRTSSSDAGRPRPPVEGSFPARLRLGSSGDQLTLVTVRSHPRKKWLPRSGDVLRLIC
jgi:hypothetical protein